MYCGEKNFAPDDDVTRNREEASYVVLSPLLRAAIEGKWNGEIIEPPHFARPTAV
jgi:hypothetical protein